MTLLFRKRDIRPFLVGKLSKAEQDAYVSMRNDHIEQVEREAKFAGGWAELAHQYLDTIAINSPPFGSLHHTLLIIGDHQDALHKCRRIARDTLTKLGAGK